MIFPFFREKRRIILRKFDSTLLEDWSNMRGANGGAAPIQPREENRVECSRQIGKASNTLSKINAAAAAEGPVTIRFPFERAEARPGAYSEIEVPVSPAMPALAFSSRVISAVRPGLDSANFSAASTLGSMLPGANCPSAAYRRASAGVR